MKILAIRKESGAFIRVIINSIGAEARGDRARAGLRAAVPDVLRKVFGKN